ncbi:hypothetical protein C6P44_003221 [Monosporozyma unispora]|nr:hypothetical protein C6P44_003221 [Kazachstania unispora]
MAEVASAINVIKHIVINDEQPEIHTLNELFDKVATALNSSNVKEEFKTIMNRQTYPMYLDTCYNLLRRKYYLTVLAEKRSFDDMNEDEATDNNPTDNKKLINLCRLVHIFWEYCDIKIILLLERLIDTRINDFSNYYSNTAIQALNIWVETYEIFLDMMRTVSPVVKYIYLNYPQISHRYIFQNNSFEDYVDKKFYDTVKKRINETDKTFNNYMKFCINGFINEGRNDVNFNEKKTLFRFAYLYNEFIDGKDLKSYYLELVKQCFEKVNISHYYANGKFNFRTLFFQELKEKALVSFMFSPTWIEPVKNLIVEIILMNKKFITDYYKAFKNSTIDSYTNYTNTDFDIIRTVYISRNKNAELNEICMEIIYDEIKALYDKNDKTSVLKIFKNLRYQIIFFSQIKVVNHPQCEYDFPEYSDSDEIPEFIKLPYIKLFGNELNLIEAIISYISVCIKISSPQNYNPAHFCDDLYVVLKKLSIPKSIIPLLIQVLFRQLLMHYSKYAEPSDVTYCSYQMMDVVVRCIKAIYKCDYSLLLDHLKENIIETLKLHDINKGSTKFFPFILKDDDIPQTYQIINEENTLHDIKLPQEIQDMWDTFISEYKKDFLPRGSSKTVTPMYGLQYCEVSTPFKRINGEPLHLELTLYQTCVLNEFNDRDTLSFPYLVETLRIESVSVKAILNSFLNYDLIKSNPDKTFSINDSFVPDERKIKNGVLRVVAHKIKPSKSTTPIATSVTANHPEGLSSVWKNELIKACIVRTLKSKNSESINRDLLFRECQPQLQGISTGEFKDALESAVKERYIDKVGVNTYTFLA